MYADSGTRVGVVPLRGRLMHWHPFTCVPRVYTGLSTRRVLVSEVHRGKCFEEVRRPGEAQLDRYADVVFRSSSVCSIATGSRSVILTGELPTACGRDGSVWKRDDLNLIEPRAAADVEPAEFRPSITICPRHGEVVRWKVTLGLVERPDLGPPPRQRDRPGLLEQAAEELRRCVVEEDNRPSTSISTAASEMSDTRLRARISSSGCSAACAIGRS
jgi:hypothetical protein